MPDRTKVPILWPSDGTQSDDIKEYTMVPAEADTTLGVCKDPQDGAWVGLTALPNLNKLGYVTARTRNNTRSSKVRFLLADHPDGEA